MGFTNCAFFLFIHCWIQQFDTGIRSVQVRTVWFDPLGSFVCIDAVLVFQMVCARAIRGALGV